MESRKYTAELHGFLSQKVKAFDQSLIQQFSSALKKIDQIRYQQFRECMLREGNMARCYE